MSTKKKTLRRRKISNSDEEEEQQVQKSNEVQKRTSALGTATSTKLSFFDEINEEADISEYKSLKFISKDSYSPMTQSSNTQEKNINTGTNVEQGLSFNEQISKMKTNVKSEIRTSDQSGRGIFALQNIPSGTLVMEDMSYASVVDDANLSIICSNCFMKGGKLLCCANCKIVYYCSKECQRNDWAIHQHECKIFVKVQRKPPTSIRLICRILIRRMSDPASFKEIENLQSNRNLFKQEKIEPFVQMSMVVRECVPKEAILNSLDMIELFCRFTENSFSIMDGEMIPNGAAIYSNTSLINHSCQPNCVVVFEKSKMMIRCIEPIMKDQEITINYIDVSQPGEERRKELQDRYYFICRCELCEYYKSKDHVDPRSALRCQNPTCSNAIEPPESLELGVEEYTSTCSVCSKEIHYDVADVEKRLSVALEFFDKGTELRDQDDRQAVTFFEQTFKIQQELLYEANYNMIRTRKTLVEIYCNLKDWKKALDHSLKLIESYRILYSKSHPLLSLQIYSTARIYLSFDYNDIKVKDLEKIDELLREALKGLEITHGYQHPITKMVEMNLWDVEGELGLKKGE
ncbi:SET domain-containing protein [Rhizophagus irregularis]|uniref:SET domain-containing protein n=1 Tax=Rhizophagus irregularis TaxID=588596 RepID=A0A2N0Q4J7_9GLOM|nr:SET domain-containing protein [Rhizophagus irregularis]